MGSNINLTICLLPAGGHSIFGIHDHSYTGHRQLACTGLVATAIQLSTLHPAMLDQHSVEP